MDIVQGISDDQLALLGCAGALLAAFTVMGVSYHVGRLLRGEQSSTTSGLSRAIVPNVESQRAEASQRRAA
ncbi:MAG: hypothetical protein DWQ34_13040 [Planctomycetota bacterium]|nr:MAG: hypothetical protein DWQ29_22010 [Planctomycetota bacterium]REJ92403.1 MAG: hypothetical protein DWQ34_13040 [Planctomycetota bacterium]REK25795.1 MAG: hypothetical protein DWQ41_11275 [Planctomycetota bacterium]REK35383.1 MAG: hypothetical protein DWQ45_11735 [Planctomycetota bacterium]